MNIQRSKPILAEGELRNLVNKLESLFNKFMKWLDEDVDEDDPRIKEDPSTGRSYIDREKHFELLVGTGDDQVKLKLTEQSRVWFETEEDLRQCELKYTLEGEDVKKEAEKKFDFVENGDKWEVPDDFKSMEQKTISDLISQLTDGKFDSFEDIKEVEACMKLGLKKIAGSTALKVTRVVSSLDVPTSLDLVGQIVTDPDILVTIPDESEGFVEVQDLGDEYSVDTCEECQVDIQSNLKNLLQCLYKLEAASRYYAWNACGIDADKVDNDCNSIMWRCRDQIDEVSRLCVELLRRAPHPFECIEPDEACNVSPDCTEVSTNECLETLIRSVIDYLRLRLCNFSEDVQVRMLGWIRDWSATVDYYMARRAR